MSREDLYRILEVALSDTAGVYVGQGQDAEAYYSQLRADIAASLCEPIHVSAIVMEPGFSGLAIGDFISGICLAHKAGYWLVYQPEQHQFYCFWGESPASLGSHGVYGTPLYCWSA